MSAIWSREGVKVPKLSEILGKKEVRAISPDFFWNALNSKFDKSS